MMKRVVTSVVLAAFGAVAVPAAGIAHSADAVMQASGSPQAEFAVTTDQGKFVVVVTPNLVNYTKASAAALAEVARYCQSIGRTAPARFGYVHRYSDFALDGWEFGGACK